MRADDEIARIVPEILRIADRRTVLTDLRRENAVGEPRERRAIGAGHVHLAGPNF
jgi:hypothetical protein